MGHIATIESSTTRATYKEGERTYNQKQMDAFHAGQTATPATHQPTAAWAPEKTEQKLSKSAPAGTFPEQAPAKPRTRVYRRPVDFDAEFAASWK